MVLGREDFGGKSASVSIRLRYIFILFVVLCGSFLIITITNIPNSAYLKSEFIISPWSRTDIVESFIKFNYTINTQGCVIPPLKPFDQEVMQFVKYPKELKPCPGSKIALLGSNRTHIWVKNDALVYYNTDDSVLNCCYMSFHRPVAVNDINSLTVDDRVQYSECKYFSIITEASDEFVKVSCNAHGNVVYQQYFLFTLKKDIKKETVLNNKTAYNVMVIGIDAVSRLNFHRTMPETLNFLKKKDTIELLGYNKVGDNTFPNLIPMLMGISERELKGTCIPNEHSTFDNCPFIWEWFKDIGYYTAFGEDSSSLGTFNYEKAGFLKTPTDYYIHTFINEAEKNVGVNKDINSFLCMNEKYFYTVLLDYIENLTVTLKTNKLFGFFWEVTISHDFDNYPMVIDKEYADFFKRLDANNYLDETIIFLVSDHGMRWGNIRATNQGRLEERLPFVYILTPPVFRNKYKYAFNNLKINSRRLTTPYDLHATLFDLTNLDTIENSMILQRKKQLNRENKGISLFLPIPASRTCALAHIDDHWCSCHKGQQLSNKSKKSLSIAKMLTRQLNKLLESYKQCAMLKLAELIEIKQLKIGSPGAYNWDEYMVVIRTTPGDGLFEATLRYEAPKWTIVGTISRLNLYGDQSRCIHNYLLKLYCYCI